MLAVIPPVPRPAAAGEGATAEAALIPVPAAELTEADRRFLERVDGTDALTVEVTTCPAPGRDLASVLAEVDFLDDHVASVEVLFRAGDYGAGLDRPNGVLRMRGHSTRRGQRKSFKIVLNRNMKPWSGMRSVNLNKHPWDLTMFRNKLSFDLLAGVPHIPTLRTGFAHLFIDGEDQGLYTVTETWTRRALKARGLDPDGWLYKAENFEFRLHPELRHERDPKYDRAAFSRVLSVEGREEHAPLLAMLAAVNDEEVDIDETVARHFDRDNYLTWLAVNVLFDNKDTNSQNFLLYRSRLIDRWYFLPWDYDGAWHFDRQADQVARGCRRSRWEEGLSNWWACPLHRRFLLKPKNRADLVALMERLSVERFSRARVAALVSRYLETVAPFARRPPDLWRWCFTEAAATAEARWAEYLGEARRIPGLVQSDLEDLKRTLERPRPVFIGDLEALGEGNFAFRWDPAVDLQGDAVFYDAALARCPRFLTGEILLDVRGTTATEIIVPLRAKPGDRFFGRLTIRDAKGNEQDPFDIWWDEEEKISRHGIRELVVR